jgi:hypothetical protein
MEAILAGIPVILAVFSTMPIVRAQSSADIVATISWKPTVPKLTSLATNPGQGNFWRMIG